LINSDDITSDKAVVSNLAPSLLGNLGRYELDITLSPISYPGVNKKAFIFDYILIVNGIVMLV
jgi:hypothetical protein